MKKILIFISIVFFSIKVQAQQKEVNNWFFGNGAGLVFDTEAGTVTATNAAQNTIRTNEGCSSMTSTDGDLLFYTDGRTIWNSNHQPMQNADYDNGRGLKGDPSSTSSGLIIPKPFSNKYYVFTVDEPHHQNAEVYPNQFNGEYHPEMLAGNPNRGFVPAIDDGYNNGLNYSLVDMDANGGLGDVDVNEKDVHLVTYDPDNINEAKYKCSEKIAAVQDEDCTGFWVITHFTNKFYAFRVNENEVVKTPVISTVPTNVSVRGYRRNGIGYLKASISGDKLVIGHGQNGNETGKSTDDSGAIIVYDFDKATGQVSNEVIVKNNVNAYGVEFSPDATKVYATYDVGLGSRLAQFDLNNNNNEVEIGKARYALQLGPDGKIYAAKDDSETIHVINEPNKVGVACDYQINAVQLAPGTTCQLGLPTFISSYIVKNVDIIDNGISSTDVELCEGDSFTLKCLELEDAEYEWRKINDDGTMTILDEKGHTLEVKEGGTYQVTVLQTKDICMRVTGKAKITLKPAPKVQEAKLESCDEDGDGQAEFDLTKANILVTTDAVTIKYYPSKDDAVNKQNEITNANAYNSAPGSVFASVKSSNSELECLSYAEIKLEIIKQADPGENSTHKTCKEGDAVDLFTLLGGTPTTGGSWTPALASGTSLFDPTKDNAGTYKYTINTPGCKEVQSEVVVTIIPDDNPAFELKPSCNGAVATITGGATGTFSFKTPPPAGDTATINPTTGEITNGTAGATYSVKFTTDGDCFAESEKEVTLLLNPVINKPALISNCDDDNNGDSLFDLTTRTDEVLGTLAANEHTVTFYPTENDANTKQNEIQTPNAYTSVSKIIWVRVDKNGTDCYSLVELELKVNASTVLNQPDPIVECNTTGELTFNLETAIPQILNGQTGILLTFHQTKDGALTKDNSIPDPTNYTVKKEETVWVRGENEVTNFCEGIISLELKAIALPDPNTTTIEVCDDDNDGFSVFNLDAEIATIKNGQETEVTFHHTEAGAGNGTSIIPDSDKYTNNTKDNEVIYVRVIFPDSGCFTVKPLPLKVLPLPEVPLDIEDYELCDDDGDNQAVFDFDTVITPQVIGNQTDVAISYHTSQADAESGNGAITPTNAYQSGDATIYIRLANTENLCSRVGQFNIKVLPMPMAVQPEDLVQCDDQDGDGLAVFDLTVKNSEITGGDNTLKVTYYESPTDAKTIIVDPTAYQSKAPSQTLFVKVGNSEGCFAPVTLTIRTVPNPTPGEPIDLVTCDDGGFDNIGTFDLTVNEAAILNGETGVKLSYHLTRGDANANEKPIADPTNHENSINGLPVNPQTIYVRVESTESEEGELQCYAVIDFNILVEPQPDFKNDVDPYTACDSDGDNTYPFDLASKTKEILGKESPDSYKVTYHETQEDANNGKNALPDVYTNNINKFPLPQTIYVRIESTSGNENCTFTAINFIIDIQDGAEANSDGDPLELMVCDDNIELDGNPANDTAVFDLTTLNEEVLDGQDPATHPVTYYVSYTDAEAGVNPIYAPEQYLSFINPQILYVRVDNNKEDDQGNDLSTCYAVTSLKLMVNPLPPIVLADEYVLCTADNDTTVNDSVLLDTGLSTNTFTFQWTKDDDTAVIGSNSTYEPTEIGVYTVTATNKNTGCTATVSTNVIPGAPPVVKAEATTFQFAEQHTVVVTASGKDGIVNTKYEFSLDNGPWVRDEVTEGSYSFYNVAPGLHEIKVRDIRGCGETVVTIMLLGYPPYFTPNEDSYHDTWNIYGIENFPEAKIHIFDRYGKLLKQISPLGDGWDGKRNGNPLPASDYWFMVEYIDKETNSVKQFKGHFSLKR